MKKQDLMDQYGFTPKVYSDQEGEFLSLSKQLKDFPQIEARLADDDVIFSDSEITVEITPKFEIQLYIPDDDYLEGPFSLSSDVGMALLKSLKV